MTDNIQRYGFRWRSNMLDEGSEAPLQRKRVASAYQGAPGGTNVDIWPGDPVKLVNDGTVALAAAGDSIYGVVAGIGPYFDGTVMAYNNHLPGATTYGTNMERQSFLWVIPVAGQVFEVECDDNTTATTEAGYNALIEENCDHSINADATSKKSFPRLDISTHNTTSAGWRIIDVSRQVNTDYSGQYVKLLVTCNEVQQAPFVTSGV